MNSWCESCARKNQCYEVDIRPRCYVSITSNDRTADRKTEPQIDDFFREPTAEERKAVAEYIESISIPTGVNVFDLMDEPQTERDGMR